MARQKAAAAAEWDFSKSLQKLNPESFFRFVAAYPNSDGASIYVYRVQPVIDRGLAGVKDSNIDILAGVGIDEEYLLRTHGSGKYHLKFTDANRPKGLTEVAKTTVEVYDPKVPPLLNPVELVVSASGNDRYVQQYVREGWTVVDGKLQPPAAKESGSAVLAETVRDLAQRAAQPSAGESTAINRLLDLVERRTGDTSGEIDRALAIAERLQPKADPVQVQMMQVLVSLLRRDEPAASRPDPVAQIRETAALLKELGFGQSSGGGGSWIDAVTALPGILQYGAQLMAQMAAMRVAESKVVSITGAPVPAAPGVPAAPPADAQGDDMLKLGFGLADLKTVGEDAIDAFQRGITGDDFAHGLCCRRNGEQLYDALCQVGKEQLLGMISMAPGLAEQLAPRRAEIDAWLDAFLKYGEGEEDPAPPAVTDPKKVPAGKVA